MERCRRIIPVGDVCPVAPYETQRRIAIDGMLKLPSRLRCVLRHHAALSFVRRTINGAFKMNVLFTLQNNFSSLKHCPGFLGALPSHGLSNFSWHHDDLRLRVVATIIVIDTFVPKL